MPPVRHEGSSEGGDTVAEVVVQEKRRSYVRTGSTASAVKAEKGA